jgi:hypothetical protein
MMSRQAFENTGPGMSLMPTMGTGSFASQDAVCEVGERSLVSRCFGSHASSS